MDYSKIGEKVSTYNSILSNTQSYRKDWSENLRKTIEDTLNEIIKGTELSAYVEIKDDIENLEVITLSQGLR